MESVVFLSLNFAVNKSVLTNHKFTEPKIEFAKEIYIDLDIGDLLLQ